MSDGAAYTYDQCRPCWLYHHDAAYRALWDKPGLGDRVASALSSVGITPELVERVTGQPCGCKGRQEALNRLGKWLRGA
jgi:hypothetical protein